MGDNPGTHIIGGSMVSQRSSACMSTFTVSVEARVPRVPVTTRIVATSEDGRQATTDCTINIR